ncbi:hypothetical protein [Shewanella salipaludis]|uniref:Uncharacterized protein n=1 Tax=Shewanella salipaludis TaxID=2723052 RepID=A0A972FUZ5_9GAMM|nr:hypothetical protein [Shewanella salipaludis]NMH65809.1 hypothetical protein [Shewanella salipaludis]
MKSNDMSEQEQALAAEIAALYRLTAQEQASLELDREILALARRQLQPGEAQGAGAGQPPRSSPWRAYRWPLSTAASVLLVAGLLLLDPHAWHRQAVPELTPMPSRVPASDAAVTGGAPAAKLRQAPEMQRQTMVADMTMPEPMPEPMSEPMSEPMPEPTPEMAASEPDLANLTLALQRLQQYLDEEDYAGARTFAQRLKARFPEVQSAQSGGHELWLRLLAEIQQADGRAR